MMQRSALGVPNMGTVSKKMKYLLKYLHFRIYSRLLIMYSHVYIHPHFLHIGILSKEYSC